MNVQTKMSEKGQVVIPKDVRDRLRFLPGDRLDIVERPDGVLLRKVKEKTGETFEEVTARIRSHVKYDGPPVSIDEMNQTIREAWIENAARRDDRARNRY